MENLGTRDFLLFPIAMTTYIHLGCNDHAYDKAKRYVALMSHLSVHDRLDNVEQLKFVLAPVRDQ
jgi:hypothetical protein